MNANGPIFRTGNDEGKPGQATRALLTLLGDDISPRFDLAPEALIAVISPSGSVTIEKSIVLSHASVEALCRLIMSEKIDLVVCCAIEDEYYQYLTWKKIKVVDSVVGPYSKVLKLLSQGGLSSGAILLHHEQEGIVE